MKDFVGETSCEASRSDGNKKQFLFRDKNLRERFVARRKFFIFAKSSKRQQANEKRKEQSCTMHTQLNIETNMVQLNCFA